MKNKVLINASNLHFGGGIQVASSFISELSILLKSNVEPFDISIICSQRVYQNLPLGFDSSVFYQFDIIDIYGLSILSKKIKNKFNGFDVCYTIFGPLYFIPKVKKHICGFAQAWIAYPNNVAYQNLSVKEYLKNKIKFKVQSLLFQRYDHLVVEQKHIKDALGKLSYDVSNISVVSNCVSSIFDDKKNWLTLPFKDIVLTEGITLGFIGRAYPHKNISVLNKVNEILIDKYKMKCNFLFTFSESEMKSCGFDEKSNFYSVGEINSMQCPAFYKLLDALVFPSLLECYSVSPIEAMKMNITVIASDYPFVKEVCGNSIFYFDPLNPNNIATAIFEAFSNTELRETKKQSGYRLVHDLPTAKDRAQSYLNIIRDSI